MINYQLERECSTLDFNMRVLHQCLLEKNPIGERFNFLKITTTNMDEFIRVRYTKHIHNNNFDIVNKLEKDIINMYKPQINVFKTLIKMIDDVDYINEIDKSVLNDNLIKECKNIMSDNIEKLDNTLGINTCKSDKLYLYMKGEIYEYKSGERFIDVSTDVKKIIYVPVEKLLSVYMDTEVIGFRILRDAYIDLDSIDENNIVDDFKIKINAREFEKIIAIEYNINTDIKALKEALNISHNILELPTEIPGLGLCNQIIDELKLDTFNNFKFNKPKVKNKTNIFDVLEKDDVLLSHPFDDYSTVIKLLESAANDKKTTEIYQTLYRVSSDNSPIVNALCKAAENGKKVTVLVEIKARFSEETNFKIIDRMKESGVHIILPSREYKVHCKAMLIVKGKKMYAHIGTGNYNEKTACVYTDLSLLTSSKCICKDLKRMFKMIENKDYNGDFSSIVSRPGKIRDTLIKEINKLIISAKEGKKAVAEIKVNAIADEIIINKIYEAAKEGVKFKIICRGSCVLQPVDNIEISSVVGRYLEHSRIYRFKTKKYDKIYISSADLLTRNLERRVELLCRIDSEVTREKIRMILKAYFKDEKNKFIKTETGWKPLDGKSSVYKVFRKDVFNETIKIKAKKKKEEMLLENISKEIIQTALINEYIESVV